MREGYDGDREDKGACDGKGEGKGSFNRERGDKERVMRGLPDLRSAL